jgi:hypothetical protein
MRTNLSSKAIQKTTINFIYLNYFTIFVTNTNLPRIEYRAKKYKLHVTTFH